MGCWLILTSAQLLSPHTPKDVTVSTLGEHESSIVAIGPWNSKCKVPYCLRSGIF
jgi:hypothetical protein